MRHKGSTFSYEKERNTELMRAFRKEVDSCSRIVISDIFRKVAESPCSRFWVTEERALVVIKEMMNGQFKCIGKCKAEMYRELFSRVMRMKEENPYMPLYKMVCFAVNSPAPKFYISPSQAKIIINRIRFSKSRLR